MAPAAIPIGMPRRAFAAALLLAGIGVGCQACKDSGKGEGAAGSASAAGSAGPAASAIEVSPGHDEIQPVYPLDAGAPDPVAQKFCDAVQELPAKRRGECCAQPASPTASSECVRTLSYALGSKAVTLDPAAVDRCVGAMTQKVEGCGWVGPFAPRVPPECLGVTKGQLAEGARCRSSLECAEGMRCYGLSATTAGQCAAPRPATAICGTGIDSLSGFTRQDDLDDRHPECAGLCAHTRCRDAVPVGGPCAGSVECGRGHSCRGGKCAAAGLPAAGQPCASGGCATGLRCVAETCEEPKADGASCESDAECVGACVLPDAGTKGTCGKRCALAIPRVPPAHSAKGLAPKPHQ